MTLEAKIKGLKPSTTFHVTTENERKNALKAGKEMKRYGIISFSLASRGNEKDGWEVGAL